MNNGRALAFSCALALLAKQNRMVKQPYMYSVDVIDVVDIGIYNVELSRLVQKRTGRDESKLNVKGTNFIGTEEPGCGCLEHREWK